MQERQKQFGKNRKLNIAFLSGGTSGYYNGFCELLSKILDHFWWIVLVGLTKEQIRVYAPSGGH